jgi:hypothetical protein
VAKKVGEIKNTTVDEIQRATTENAMKLFAPNDEH